MPTLKRRMLAQPDHLRAAFIDAQADLSSSQRDELQQALVLARLDPDYLNNFAWPEEDRDLPLGFTVGHYRIKQELGRGGMGIVYLGQRSGAQLQQQVAIKVLRHAADQPELLTRFIQEQNILARLSHANIATLYDAGTVWHQGHEVPYCVMEYIDGRPLLEYTAPLTLGARLAVFRDVVAAVHYAHSNLVVHRDLKSSNVLVTEDGVPKLLDFGIAKLLPDIAAPILANASAPNTSQLTQTGHWVFTPENMAPEQFTPNSVTVATDIYQLGLILYQLLSDKPAFPQANQSLLDIARSIHQRLAPRPSRSGLLAATGRHTQSELDSITLKCLEQQPTKRYPSADALLADINAHLRGQPVQAHQASWWYRANSFARRNAMACFAAAALAGFAGVYFVTLVVQNERIAQALNEAQLESSKAQEVTEFLTNLFREASPDAGNANTTSARQLLQRGAVRLNQTLDQQPRTKIELLNIVGELHQELGLYRESLPLLKTAEAIQDDQPAQLLTKARTAHLIGIGHRDSGEHQAAVGSFNRALTALERIEPPPQLRAKILNDLGSALQLQVKLSQAVAHYQQALGVFADIGQADSRAAAAAWNNLGTAYQQLTQYPQAIDAHQNALRIRRQALGENNWTVAMSMNNLGASFAQVGRAEDAEHLHRQALALQERLFEETHPAITATLTDLGRALTTLQRYDAAASVLQDALAKRIAHHGTNSYSAGTGHYVLAATYEAMNAPAKAKSHLEQVLAIDILLYGESNPTVARVLLRLAELNRRQGQQSLAIQGFTDALTMLEGNSLLAAQAHYGLARTLPISATTRALHHAKAAQSIQLTLLPQGHDSRAQTESLVDSLASRAQRDSQ